MPDDDELARLIPAPTPGRSTRDGGEKDVPNATAARLRISLERIVEETLELTRGIGVHRLERDLGTAVIVTGADFYFDNGWPIIPVLHDGAEEQHHERNGLRMQIRMITR
jgi:hypothetical protein